MQQLFLLLFFSIFFSINAQQLSENAEISVLTVGPGTSLNDAFGHSGFRIKDKANGLDIVYGYGEYDFDAPNFYLKFAQGKLNYLISKTTFSHFYKVYKYYNRSIDEQVLNLNDEQKQKLYNFLVNNYNPKNRRYLYDFFFNNCATKIKDVVNIATKNSIEFNIPEGYEEATFRTLIQYNLNKNSWGSLGIDLALGAVIDRKTTPEQHLFLPKNIYGFFNNAKINKQPLVTKSHTILKVKPVALHHNFLLSPLFILSLIGVLIICITYKDYKHQKQTKIMDAIIFTLTGVIGIFILLLWFATDHESTHANYNLLWANALNLIAISQLFKAKIKTWFIKYLKLLVILLCLLTLHWLIGIQVFAISLIPLLIAICIRYVFLIKHYNGLQ